MHVHRCYLPTCRRHPEGPLESSALNLLPGESRLSKKRAGWQGDHPPIGMPGGDRIKSGGAHLRAVACNWHTGHHLHPGSAYQAVPSFENTIDPGRAFVETSTLLVPAPATSK